MAYTSNKLCHFVGRSLKNDRERLNLLLEIIDSGRLLAHPNKPNGKPSIKTSSTYEQIDDLGEPFSHIDCVCFCDIPDSELAIHTKKYSKVGLGFSKDFLVNAGVRPVQYVPLGFHMRKQMEGCITPDDPKKYYIAINRLMIYTLLLMDVVNVEDNSLIKLFLEKKETSELVNAASIHIEANLPELFSGIPLHSFTYALLQHIINSNAYVKLFNPTLEDNDPSNYYMEREWRSLQNVTFTVDDIKSIYLPGNIELRNIFIKKFPNLEEKIIIIE